MARQYPKKSREFLQQFLARMDKHEKAEMILLANKWGVVSNKLDAMINRLAYLPSMSRNQLYLHADYKAFLILAKAEITKFNAAAAGEIVSSQRLFAGWGVEATTNILNTMGANLRVFPVKPTHYMIGKSSNGSPLFKLLQKSYPDTITRLTDTLITGVARGINPVVLAREMAKDMGGNLKRALLIARTEQLNVFREASMDSMKRSGVVSGWVWVAEDSACPICLEKDGTVYDLDEPMDEHPNGRCGQGPVVG
jgi:SPP1 gp7 family putative phage head morphogenesis protein